MLVLPRETSGHSVKVQNQSAVLPSTLDQHIRYYSVKNGWDVDTQIAAFQRLLKNHPQNDRTVVINRCLRDLWSSKPSTEEGALRIPATIYLMESSFSLRTSKTLKPQQIRIINDLIKLAVDEGVNTSPVYLDAMRFFQSINSSSVKEASEFQDTLSEIVQENKNIDAAVMLLRIYAQNYVNIKLSQDGVTEQPWTYREFKRYLSDLLEQKVCPKDPHPFLIDSGIVNLNIKLPDGNEISGGAIIHQESIGWLKNSKIIKDTWPITRRLLSVSRGFEYLKYMSMRVPGLKQPSDLVQFGNLIAGSVNTFKINNQGDRPNFGVLLKSLDPVRFFPNDPIAKLFGTDPLQELKEIWPVYSEGIDLLKDVTVFFSRNLIFLYVDREKTSELDGCSHALCFFNEHYQNNVGIEALSVPVSNLESVFNRVSKDPKTGMFAINEQDLLQEIIVARASQSNSFPFNLLSLKSLMTGMIHRTDRLDDLHSQIKFAGEVDADLSQQVRSLTTKYLSIFDLISFARARFNKGELEGDPLKQFRRAIDWHNAHNEGLVKSELVPLLKILPSRTLSGKFDSPFILDPITLKYTLTGDQGIIPFDPDFFRQRELELALSLTHKYAKGDNNDLIFVPRTQLK